MYCSTSSLKCSNFYFYYSDWISFTSKREIPFISKNWKKKHTHTFSKYIKLSESVITNYIQILHKTHVKVKKNLETNLDY